MEPGIYTDLSNEAYHGDHKSYSKSSLADFSYFPYNLIWQRKHPKDRSKFDLGTACHTAILELDKWEKDVAVIPPDVLAKNGAKSTTAYKEWSAAQPKHKAQITVKQRDQVMRVCDSVHKNPAHSKAHEYLSNGIPELSAFWNEQFKSEETDEETGFKFLVSHTYGEPDGCHQLLMKARPDYIPADRITVDLKTTEVELSEEPLTRHCYNLKYHWSAALTLRGLTMATGKQHREYFFVFVQVSKGQPVPHEVKVVRASQEFLALGRKEVMHVMERLAWCDKNDKWPGIPNKVHQLGLPGYVYKKLYDEGNF